MRSITLQYPGECRACGAQLPVGAGAIYERRVGVWCPPCAPTDHETIREARQEAADRKADQIEGWAASRRHKAEALDAQNAPYRGDVAFDTQPGHIPERARAIARTERAWGHTAKALDFEARADRLRRGVRVAGDAERERQAKREAVRAWLRVGMRVETGLYGFGVVERINRKTATIGQMGQHGTDRTTVDLVFLRP